MNVVHSFVNYVIFRELCNRMRFEVDCAKSHHRVISEGLIISFVVIICLENCVIMMTSKNQPLLLNIILYQY